MARSGGGSVAQRSSANRHRGRNEQPAGVSSMLGGWPGMGRGRPLSPATGIDSSRPRV